MKKVLLTILVVIIVYISGCGSVSGIIPTKPHTLPELSAYDKIIVMDFNDSTKYKEPEKVKIAGRTFADLIALQIKNTKLFSEVSREKIPGKAIIVGGTITRYEEGSTAGRLLVGFGAGSSYFDAAVVFKDTETGEEIATLKVDKNSWV